MWSGFRKEKAKSTPFRPYCDNVRLDIPKLFAHPVYSSVEVVIAASTWVTSVGSPIIDDRAIHRSPRRQSSQVGAQSGRIAISSHPRWVVIPATFGQALSLYSLASPELLAGSGQVRQPTFSMAMRFQLICASHGLPALAPQD